MRWVTPSRLLFIVNESEDSSPHWGSSYRLVASEKWKAKSAIMGRDATNALVDFAEPKPGMQILDLASGTGEPAISLATAIGPTGHVTALDLSQDLLDITTQRASQRGLTNITTQVADAQHLPFAGNSFDLGTSRFGVMFFADPVRALRELHRVLRPGARACFLAWGTMDQPYWASGMGIVHQHVGGTLLAPGGADPFRFSEPGSLSGALGEAGFADIKEEARVIPWNWPGPADEVWEQQKAVSAPFRPMLERVPQDQWAAINAEVVQAIQKFQRGDTIYFTATVVFASGRKA
jgi:SAM-dependent methyltransferase